MRRFCVILSQKNYPHASVNWVFRSQSVQESGPAQHKINHISLTGQSPAWALLGLSVHTWGISGRGTDIKGHTFSKVLSFVSQVKC